MVYAKEGDQSGSVPQKGVRHVHHATIGMGLLVQSTLGPNAGFIFLMGDENFCRGRRKKVCH